MAIEVSFCTEPDFLRIFAIISDAFAGDQPYMDTMYPNHHTAHGRSEGAERLLHMKRTDATNRFLKATDTATGEIIGQAKWNVVENGMPEQTKLAGSYWESQDEDEKEYAEFLYEVCLEPIRRMAKSVEGPLVVLDILTVDPKHQRRGAGRMLVEWGVRMADERGAEMCVEASVFGIPLYEQSGFQFVEYVEIQVPEKWKGRPKIEFTFMRRPAASQASKVNPGENL